MTKIFIDGSAGTTGLRIHDRLATRSDLTLLTLSEELRKDPAARRAQFTGGNVKQCSYFGKQSSSYSKG